jgi:dipeptide/tripeptide permease
VAGICSPIITGYLAGPENLYSRAFALAAVILAGGIASYVLLLGKIEPVPEEAS